MALPVRQQLLYWGIAAAVFFVLLWAIGDVMLPFLVGGAIAYFLDPIADRLERAGLSRVGATVTISHFVLLVAVLLILAIIPTLIQQLTGLINAVKTARAKLNLENGETWAQQFIRKVTPAQLVAFAVLIFLYMLGMEYVGFLLASSIFLAASMYLLGSRRVVLNLFISAAVLVAIFIVFRTAFSVVLPAGSLVGPHLPEFLK